MTIDELIQNFHVQKELVIKEIDRLDGEFSNNKLNTYGVTTIDFQQRSDAYSQKSRLEGAIDALFIVKKQIFNDDGEVEIPDMEDIMGETELETVGKKTEGNEDLETLPDTFPTIDDANIPGDPSY